MANKNETVVVKLSADNRRKLLAQVEEQIEGLALPRDLLLFDTERLTLAQLVVLAVKLKARIVISNINIVPKKD
jgi:hypothetical protein